MQTDYQPKHKRVLRDGQIARGPARWARAYANLMENPNSKAATLLLERLATASCFRLEGDKQAYEHLTVMFPRGGRPDSNKRDYLTCSKFCAAMVIQLDIASTSVQDVARMFTGTYVRTHRYNGQEHTSTSQPEVRQIARSKRPVRCQHCGTKVGV